MSESTKTIEFLINWFEEAKRENDRDLQEKKQAFEVNKLERTKIINDSKTSSDLRFRNAIMNFLDSDEILQISIRGQNLIVNELLAVVVGKFQEEVKVEIENLKLKNASQTAKIEEPKNYLEIETEIQKIKQTLEDEYRPLMDSLKEEMENRRKYLDAHR